MFELLNAGTHWPAETASTIPMSLRRLLRASLPWLCFWMCFSCPGPDAQAAPAISQITDNRSAYPNGRIPRYEKLEIDFQVANTAAQNLQMPFDAAPPAGVPAGIGITVNALFTPDNWQTVFTQPAFHFQEFQDEVRSNREWFYPTGRYVWKVRFAPHVEGNWQYKLAAQDAGGAAESGIYSFTVSSSSNHGFIRVGRRDPRYFEFEDGTYFPALGYNMNYDHVSWTNPVLDNQNNFQAMAANGIQLVRMWLSQWAVFGSEWNPWNSQDPAQHGLYLPATGITLGEAYPGSDASMVVSATSFKCMFVGAWKARAAVKRNTNYRIRIRYKTSDITGPIDPGRPCGFVAKIGNWLWSDNESQRCYAPGTGTTVTPHQNLNTSGYEILQGGLNSGNADFLPNFFLVMENTAQGRAFVDYVWIEEDLGNGTYGPNIVSKPWMAHHWYFEQRNSYAFDKLLNLAKANGIYLRPVILEKNDRLFGSIDYNGSPVPFANNVDYFYGNWRQITKVRWLQRAYWRYLQARWGYAPNIHSWELLNEGDPTSDRHYALADEFGKYMHQFGANRHLVSTSNWHSFPKNTFWANPSYPDVDFADVHLYIPRDASYSLRVDGNTFQIGAAADYADTAAATSSLSSVIGAQRPNGAGKPVVRGETGFVASGSEPHDPQLLSDREGIWLHNYIWGGINPGGLIESYWYEREHIYGRGGDGIDLRYRFRSYSDFIKTIPLNSGSYQDAVPNVTHALLRALGQKDTGNGRAHLWIQNIQHTWRNVVAGGTVTPATGSVTLTGFRPSASYPVEWWDTYSGRPARTENITADGAGSLTLQVANLATDIAVRIGTYGGTATTPAAPRNLRIVSNP